MMKNLTNEELVDKFIQDVTYSNPDCMEMKHELLSRLNRVSELEKEHARAIEKLERILPIIKFLIDDTDCRFDHHGLCQEHGGDIDDVCINTILKKILAEEG